MIEFIYSGKMTFCRDGRDHEGMSANMAVALAKKQDRERREFGL